MAVEIIQLKNPKTGINQYPIVLPESIIDENGNNLNEIIENKTGFKVTTYTDGINTDYDVFILDTATATTSINFEDTSKFKSKVVTLIVNANLNTNVTILVPNTALNYTLLGETDPIDLTTGLSVELNFLIVEEIKQIRILIQVFEVTNN